MELWTGAEGAKICPNARVLPSGDQVGSRSETEPNVICSAAPPEEGRRKMFQACPCFCAEKAMRFPCGDQWGRATRNRGLVSCTGSLPSARLRQSVWSG